MYTAIGKEKCTIVIDHNRVHNPEEFVGAECELLLNVHSVNLKNEIINGSRWFINSFLNLIMMVEYFLKSANCDRPELSLSYHHESPTQMSHESRSVSRVLSLIAGRRAKRCLLYYWYLYYVWNQIADTSACADRSDFSPERRTQ
jgi:hypothetical protein